MPSNCLCVNAKKKGELVHFRALCAHYEVSKRITRQSGLICWSDRKTSERRVLISTTLHYYFSHLNSFSSSFVALKLVLKENFNTNYDLPNDEGAINLFFFPLVLFSPLRHYAPIYSLPSIICSLLPIARCINFGKKTEKLISNASARSRIHILHYRSIYVG